MYEYVYKYESIGYSINNFRFIGESLLFHLKYVDSILSVKKSIKWNLLKSIK